MAVLSFAEVVVAIIAAALCCCCTSWATSNQKGVVFMNATQSGVILPHTQIPMTTGHQVMIATGQTNNPVVQYYPRAQQYQVLTTTQPTVAQIQSFGGTQQEPNNTQVYDTNPPVYKE